MLIKIGLPILGVLVLFLIYVSTRETKFHYSVTRTINAPVEKVFPYLSDFKLGSQWSPYETDPNIKREYLGNKMNFESKDSGSGTLEFLKIVPNQSVDMSLVMTAPISVSNLVQYKVVPVNGGTEFTWSMTGENGYFMKLVGVFINCEKMFQDKFDEGFTNLKKIVEN